MKAVNLLVAMLLVVLSAVSVKAETQQFYTTSLELEKNFKDNLFGPDALQPFTCRVRFESPVSSDKGELEALKGIFLGEAFLLMRIFDENGWQSRDHSSGDKPGCGILFTFNEQYELEADISMGGVTERVAREEEEEDATYFRRVQKNLIEIIAYEGIIDPNK
jgi:hypothetical protein